MESCPSSLLELELPDPKPGLPCPLRASVLLLPEATRTRGSAGLVLGVCLLWKELAQKLEGESWAWEPGRPPTPMGLEALGLPQPHGGLDVGRLSVQKGVGTGASWVRIFPPDRCGLTSWALAGPPGPTPFPGVGTPTSL